MFESMYAAKGVGLAAPQIGFAQEDLRHRCLQRREAGGQARPDQSQDRSRRRQAGGEEGCLSIPGFREQVRRAKRVTVRAQNAKGEEFEMTGEDLLARAFLHETDHLHGTPLHHPHQRAEARPDEAQDQEAAARRGVGMSAPRCAWSFWARPRSPSPRWSAWWRPGTRCWRWSLSPTGPAAAASKPPPSPVKEAALRLGLPVYQPERVRRPEAVEYPARA